MNSLIKDILDATSAMISVGSVVGLCGLAVMLVGIISRYFITRFF